MSYPTDTMPKDRKRPKPKPPPEPNPWPEKLVAYRALLGITQQKAAAQVGVSRRSWIGWETGEQIPSKPVAILLDLLIAQAKKNPAS